MKNKIKMSIATIVLFVMTSAANHLFAQASAGGKEYVEIQTSAICGSCKATIEKAVNNVEGVESASLDLKTKKIAVKYDAKATSAEDIKKAIAHAGYSADNLPAEAEAYDNLDGCCKKE